MDKDELIDFLRGNVTIEISRDQDYYSYPHIEVKLKVCGELIDSSQCTIYDGDHNG
jgi:hypothetical protein